MNTNIRTTAAANMDYNDLQKVTALLEDAQQADDDLREDARNAHDFIDKKDGQWEPKWWTNFDGQPRYTFDKTSPIVNTIANQFIKADFGIDIKPSTGEASKETAKVLDGLIRNIQTQSNASHVFNAAGKSMVTAGLDGWRVVQKYCDQDSFDQELAIETIPNFVDRVWFDTNSTLQDRSDSEWCFVLQVMTMDAYKDRWPEGAGSSVSDNVDANSYYDKPSDQVIVGEFLYRKAEVRDLVLMTNGASYDDTEEFQSIADDLSLQGINEAERRSRKVYTVQSRLFDGSDWLTDEAPTVFTHIPVIPTYGNFKVTENKILFRGVVQKMMDAQRVLNYSKSRQIAETSLAPRAKYWLTRKQAKGEQFSLRTMNTNNDPVQYYTPDPLAPGVPMQSGGAMLNQGIQDVAMSASNDLAEIAGQFAASQGANPGLQSGVAISSLQDAGADSSLHFFESQEIAITATCRVLVEAIPKVYDTEREVRILSEDGSYDMQTLNQSIIDNETGQPVTVNDLSLGGYDAVCRVGKAYKTRQDEAVAGILEVAQVDPSLLAENSDILLSNMSYPGSDEMAERKREQLFKAGMIPQSQWTDEEAQQMQQMQQQPQQPDAMMIAAQAEQAKADAEMAKVQQKAQYDQESNQIEMAKIQQKAQFDQEKNQLEMAKIQLKLQEAQNNSALNEQKFEFDRIMKMQAAQAQAVMDLISGNKTNAETMKIIYESTGANAIVDPAAIEAYHEQAEIVQEGQQVIDSTLRNVIP